MLALYEKLFYVEQFQSKRIQNNINSVLVEDLELYNYVLRCILTQKMLNAFLHCQTIERHAPKVTGKHVNVVAIMVLCTLGWNIV